MLHCIQSKYKSLFRLGDVTRKSCVQHSSQNTDKQPFCFKYRQKAHIQCKRFRTGW